MRYIALLLACTSALSANPAMAKQAIVYYREQEDEKAFRAFLEALESVERLPVGTVSPEEKALYEKALAIYLAYPGASAREGAKKIQEEFGPVLAAHRGYHLLNFLVAAAYANLGLFDEFFQRFYEAYRYYPDHYMAYRTKTILHIKLFERTASVEARAAVVANAKKAHELNPLDTSLYKVIADFSPDLLPKMVEEILERGLVVPRGDLLFYVKALVARKHFPLAEKFMDRAKEWYPVSRNWQVAKEYLEAHN